jgi:hypothetical protein
MYTIQEIKQANTAAGHYFFSRDTMRFFGNRMSDFRVVQVHALDQENDEVYIVAHNHRAPQGVDPFSVYQFDPATGDVSRVSLSKADVHFMRLWKMCRAEYTARRSQDRVT